MVEGCFATSSTSRHDKKRHLFRGVARISLAANILAPCRLRASSTRSAAQMRTPAPRSNASARSDSPHGSPRQKKTPLLRCRENFACSEYFSALPLTSELDALCGANANSRASLERFGAERFSSRVTTTKKDTSFEVSVVVTRGRIELPFQP